MCILVVEDNPISLRTVEMILQSHGLETVSAKSGKLAVEKLQSRDDIQLVLSDLMMPEMDGYQLLEVMGKHESWKTIPVIVMTSLSDADTVKRVVALGSKNYVVKPIREETLLPKVKQFMLESAVGDAPLKAKFKVLEETGLTQDKYEELFDAFRQLVKDAEKAFEAGVDPANQDDGPGKAAMALREGASVLAQGRLPALLEGFRARSTCDWATFRQVLTNTSKAMDAAADKRDRLRSKLAAQTESVPPVA
ncbi:MAG: response regulator [Fibrobacterota bacterium]